MKKILVFLTSSILSLQSQASIEGNWTGWGFWAFRNEEDFTRCDLMKMRWLETQDALTLAHGFYDCGIVRMEVDPVSWKKKGPNLLDENGQISGTYDGQNLDIKIQSPVEGTQIHISLKREANHFDYREIWFNEREKVYIIKGRLFTQ